MHWSKLELPVYLLVDEEHPVAPWNGYGTSKLAGEASAERVVNHYDVLVRPSWIQIPGECVITELREAFELKTGPDGELLVLRRYQWCHIVRGGGDTDPCWWSQGVQRFHPDNFLGINTAVALEAGFGNLPIRWDPRRDDCVFSTGRPNPCSVGNRFTLGRQPRTNRLPIRRSRSSFRRAVRAPRRCSQRLSISGMAADVFIIFLSSIGIFPVGVQLYASKSNTNSGSDESQRQQCTVPGTVRLVKSTTKYRSY